MIHHYSVTMYLKKQTKVKKKINLQTNQILMEK
jgi:hypothetical protein